MFTNCDAVTVYHREAETNVERLPVFTRYVIRNVYWEQSIGSRQNGTSTTPEDSIYLCIPASSVGGYIPQKEDVLCYGEISPAIAMHDVQQLPEAHTIQSVIDCRYGSAAVQHIEVIAL